MELIFINPEAKAGRRVTVSAVNSGEPLEYGKAYAVPPELADRLLETGDWAKKQPHAKGEGGE